jgi:hypothetical protein
VKKWARWSNSSSGRVICNLFVRRRRKELGRILGQKKNSELMLRSQTELWVRLKYYILKEKGKEEVRNTWIVGILPL